MSDKQLNEAIHTEVEGWKWGAPDDCGLWVRGKAWDNHMPDYCHDPKWCVAMIEEHKFILTHRAGHGVLWAVYEKYGSDALVVDQESLTRAVALAVLELTRRKE